MEEGAEEMTIKNEATVKEGNEEQRERETKRERKQMRKIKI